MSSENESLTKRKYGISLTQENLEQIRELAAGQFSPGMIARYFSIPKGKFIKAWRDETSPVRKYYDVGELQSKLAVNQKLAKNAEAGNITAAQILQKTEREKHVENLKEQMLYGD